MNHDKINQNGVRRVISKDNPIPGETQHRRTWCEEASSHGECYCEDFANSKCDTSSEDPFLFRKITYFMKGRHTQGNRGEWIEETQKGTYSGPDWMPMQSELKDLLPDGYDRAQAMRYRITVEVWEPCPDVESEQI